MRIVQLLAADTVGQLALRLLSGQMGEKIGDDEAGIGFLLADRDAH